MSNQTKIIMIMFAVLLAGSIVLKPFNVSLDVESQQAQANVTPNETDNVAAKVVVAESLPTYDDTIQYSDEHINLVTEWAYKQSKKYVPIEDVKEIVEEASRYKTFLLLVSVMCEESRFDRYARSSKNALGLGQIMHSVWLDTLKKEGIAQEKIDLFYYRTNIKAMNYILLKYYRDKGSWKNALSSYVNGSKPYVMNVLSNYAELQLLLNGV